LLSHLLKDASFSHNAQRHRQTEYDLITKVMYVFCSKQKFTPAWF